MFLRTYLIIALVLMLLGWITGANLAVVMVIVAGLGVTTLAMVVAATLWELWHVIAGGQVARRLLLIRLSRFLRMSKAAHDLAGRLAVAEGLSFDANDRDEPGRIARIFLRLREMNGHVPSAFGRLLPGMRVAKLMWDAKAPKDADRAAWDHLITRIDSETRAMGARPSRFTHSGRMFNERFGRIFWSKTFAEVYATVASGRALALKDAKRDYPEPSDDPSMRERMMWEYAEKTLPFYDLEDPRDLGLLPVPVQLRLIALHAALFGSDNRLGLLRRVFFRHADFLDGVRDLRERFQRAQTEQADADREEVAQKARISESVLAAEQTAALLVRDWPLEGPASHQSFLGGLPSLPDDMPWPEVDGEPLTFLAELDCAEMPRGGGLPALPTSGRLLFFAAMEEIEADIPARVIRVADDAVPSAGRALPEDVAALAKWPVTPSLLPTYAFPKTAAPEALSIAGARLDAGITALLPERGKPVRVRMFDTVEVEHPETGEMTSTTALRTGQLGDAFPYSGAVAKAMFTKARQIAGVRVASVAELDGDLDAPLKDLLVDLDDLLAVLAQMPDQARVSEEVQETLLEFIASSAQEPSGIARSVFETAIRDTLLAFARDGASDPDIRDLFDPVVYELWRAQLAPHPAHAKHILLGSSALKSDAEGLPLLQLDSDAGTGMLFGENGQLTFWIALEDLAEGNFDNVVAHLREAEDQDQVG